MLGYGPWQIGSLLLRESLITTLVGFYVGSGGAPDVRLLLLTLLGAGLAAGGALALNQYIERDLDARMERTRGRPLPSET